MDSDQKNAERKQLPTWEEWEEETRAIIERQCAPNDFLAPFDHEQAASIYESRKAEWALYNDQPAAYGFAAAAEQTRPAKTEQTPPQENAAAPCPIKEKENPTIAEKAADPDSAEQVPSQPETGKKRFQTLLLWAYIGLLIVIGVFLIVNCDGSPMRLAALAVLGIVFIYAAVKRGKLK